MNKYKIKFFSEQDDGERIDEATLEAIDYATALADCMNYNEYLNEEKINRIEISQIV